MMLILKDYASKSIIEENGYIKRKQNGVTILTELIEVMLWAMLKCSYIEVCKKKNTLSHRVSTFVALSQFKISVGVLHIVHYNNSTL